MGLCASQQEIDSFTLWNNINGNSPKTKESSKEIITKYDKRQDHHGFWEGGLVFTYALPVRLLNPMGASALHLCRDAELMQLFVDCGGDIEVRDKELATPLHYAAKAGDAEVLRILLDAAPDKHLYVTVKDQYGNTALHYAAREGHLHIAEVILEKHKNPDGNEASGDDSSKFRYNIDIHDHLSMNNQFGNTPLYFADYFASYWKKQQDMTGTVPEAMIEKSKACKEMHDYLVTRGFTVTTTLT